MIFCASLFFLLLFFSLICNILVSQKIKIKIKITSYNCRIFLAGYLLWSLDLPKKGFCTSVPIGTCVFILSPDHNIINIPSSYKKFYCKTQENKGHTFRRGGSKIIHGGTLSFVMSRRCKASWSGRSPVLLVLSLPLVQLLCSYYWLVYKHTGWGFCLMCYTYTLKCVWTLRVWLTLFECLDGMRPHFARLVKNYMDFMLLFMNPTKRWKIQMNYFVLFTLLFSWSYSIFSPKNQLAYKLFCYNTFSNKFSVFNKISGIQIGP